MSCVPVPRPKSCAAGLQPTWRGCEGQRPAASEEEWRSYLRRGPRASGQRPATCGRVRVCVSGEEGGTAAAGGRRARVAAAPVAVSRVRDSRDGRAGEENRGGRRLRGGRLGVDSGARRLVCTLVPRVSPFHVWAGPRLKRSRREKWAELFLDF